MPLNINTIDYWENRFSSGDRENNRGRIQTKLFAKARIKYMKFEPGFSGTILDFGCGQGDAMPVYHSAYPNAKLIGMDISETAILKSREIYSKIATFMQGDYLDVVEVDVIIVSNVLEHLTDDLKVVSHLIYSQEP